MIAASARASGSVITNMTNRAADKLTNTAAMIVTEAPIANRETELRNWRVILIINATTYAAKLRLFGAVAAFLMTNRLIVVTAGY